MNGTQIRFEQQPEHTGTINYDHMQQSMERQANYQSPINVDIVENFTYGGYLDFSQAMRHYKYGHGSDVQVDISNYDLSMIKSEDFNNEVGSQAQIDMFRRNMFSPAGQVFGNIRFEYLGNNQVKDVDYFPEGHPNVGDPYYDTFNYNIRWDEGFTIRNFGTGLGWMYSRFPYIWMPDVHSYKIYFFGTGNIGGN